MTKSLDNCFKSVLKLIEYTVKGRWAGEKRQGGFSCIGVGKGRKGKGRVGKGREG
jgi:hypothetical protein